MYIPATSTSIFQSRCSTVGAMPPVEHTDAVSMHHPPLTLQRQMAKRAFFPHNKQQKQRPAYTPPAIIRKDSGEIVRPCLRKHNTTPVALSERSSSPKPMRPPRFVHFGADLENIRWFFKGQSPQAVREDVMSGYCSSVSEDRRTENVARQAESVRMTALRRPSPSFAVFEDSPVVVEQVELADRRLGSATLRGTVKVHNIAFEKDVAVRYSFDQWRTAAEVSAAFSRTLAEQQGERPGVDRFTFTLALPEAFLAALPGTVTLCARYRVADSEHWDNNGGANYIFKIALPAAPAIADDDCDAVPTRAAAQATELQAPRRLTFGSAKSSTDVPQRFSAPSAADTRRYMAQSAVLFGSPSADKDSSSASVTGNHSSQARMQHQQQQQLPLFQDVAWCGSDFADASSMLMPSATAYHHAFLPSSSSSPLLSMMPRFSSCSPLSATHSLPATTPRSASPLASPIRIGSPVHRAVFDSDSAVRTGSPLAWSHSNSTASALQC
ncbi:hypothetical protein IWW36_001983 [Coemansia brasiliensis]|uniref:CBM21 domain-containing protein n=1 Tax=Coemansia brasiliensis TaxID=2650707 RepID=A0A9W8IAK4_9FUNG|nr:hypothetical protein IWW36_001983 [Coemansia brasiliensis]